MTPQSGNSYRSVKLWEWYVKLVNPIRMRLNIVILNYWNFLKTPSFIRFACLEMKEYE